MMIASTTTTNVGLGNIKISVVSRVKNSKTKTPVCFEIFSVGFCCLVSKAVDYGNMVCMLRCKIDRSLAVSSANII